MTIRTEIRRITPAEAKALLAGQIRNRPISKARVSTYLREMQEGRWALTGQGIILFRLLTEENRISFLEWAEALP